MAPDLEELLGPSVRRRRLAVYLACGAVVIACAAALAVLLTGDRATGPAPPGGAPAAGPPAEPGRPATEVPGVPVPEPLPPTPPPPPAGEAPPLREASSLFERGMEHLRAAMEGVPGSDERAQAFRDALDLLMAAQEAYEVWLDEHPEDEARLDGRLTDLQQQLYWCRKSMPATAFPASAEPASEPGTSRPEPPPTRPGPRPIPAPRFVPAAAAARFQQIARQALQDGRPDLVLEAGEPLLGDERMEGHLGKIPETVMLARGMEALLEAVRTSLRNEAGREVTLRFRNGDAATGILAAGSPGFAIGEGRGFRAWDLGAGEIAARAGAAGGLGDAGARLAGGCYLLFRGDVEEGARLLVAARAGGAEVPAEIEPLLSQALERFPEVRALAAWLALAPRLGDEDPSAAAAAEHFLDQHRDSAVFREHREQLFAARASRAAKDDFDEAELFTVLDRVSGRGVRLLYRFEAGDEILDFTTWGEWTTEAGTLKGARGSVFLERFDLEAADFRFVLPRAHEMAAGLWGEDRRGREGVNVHLRPEPDGLHVRLCRGERPFAAEVIPVPEGRIEVLLQKRGHRYQVAINRKPLLKGTDGSRAGGDGLFAAGFSCRGGPVEVVEAELVAELDREWAKAGGNRFAVWIRDWHLAGPFPLEKFNAKVALALPCWPEEGEPDVEALDEEGRPRWRAVRSDADPLDLNRHFRPNDRVVGYAAARIWCPERRTAILEVRCDDDAKAWLNGEVVLPEAPIGAAHRAAVKLRKGDNLLLVKVAEDGGAWWVRARLLTKGGERMTDVVCW